MAVLKEAVSALEKLAQGDDTIRLFDFHTSTDIGGNFQIGAVQKAGRAPLAEVVNYGSRAREPGVALLEAPGNDAISSTALAAAGAALVLFTTGKGTPLGAPVPTVKVASNHELAQAKPHWIDFDAARVLDEESANVVADFLDRIIAFASGEDCAAERGGQRTIAIWKRGATL